MGEGKKLCMGCMNPVPDTDRRCPVCGFDKDTHNSPVALDIGEKLKNARYAVGRQNDADAESVSYIGYDLTQRRKVIIKEYLIADGCRRESDKRTLVPKQGAELHYKTSKNDFCELYETLAKIQDQPGMIKVLDFFAENGTFYAILEFFDGITLKAFLKLRGGRISSERCVSLLNPVFDAVEAIHAANLLHRGISSETIYVDRDGRVKLAGYATAAVRTMGNDMNPKLFTGYSAPEQYSTSQFQTTATDVYALGAVAYRCISGVKPQEADQRRSYDHIDSITDLFPDEDARVSQTVEHAMLTDQKERVQTPNILKLMLAGEYEPEEPVNTGVDDGIPQAERKDKQSRWLRALLSSSVVLFLALLLIFGVKSRLIAQQTAAAEAEAAAEEASQSALQSDVLDVPSFVGLTLSDAQKQFSRDFRFRIVYSYESTKIEGTVIRQEPAAGGEAQRGSEMVLYVNEPAIVTMIDLRGMTKDNAEAALEQLLVGRAGTAVRINYNARSTDEFAEGTVIEQSTMQGAEFNVSTEVLTLTLAMK